MLSGCPEFWLAKVLETSVVQCFSIPANHPDFIRTIPCFDFQNLLKLEWPNFLEFQLLFLSTGHLFVKQHFL